MSKPMTCEVCGVARNKASRSSLELTRFARTCCSMRVLSSVCHSAATFFSVCWRAEPLSSLVVILALQRCSTRSKARRKMGKLAVTNRPSWCLVSVRFESLRGFSTQVKPVDEDAAFQPSHRCSSNADREVHRVGLSGLLKPPTRFMYCLYSVFFSFRTP